MSCASKKAVGNFNNHIYIHLDSDIVYYKINNYYSSKVSKTTFINNGVIVVRCLISVL